MAPHVGFDPEYIRDKARKDLLYLLEGVRGKKNLILERSLAGPLGVIVKVSTLHDYGVDKFFFLENNNADTSQRNVVFMARGECARHAQAIADQVKRLQRESQTVHEFHVFWVPRRTIVSDRLLEEAGVLGDVSITELPIFFFPLERDVLSLELGDSFRDLYLFKDTTPAFLMAKALMGVQSKHGLFPRVVGKGDNAKRIAELLTRMRQEILAGEVVNETTSKSGLTPSNSIESVIIIDREVDFVTPLLSQLTYEGLIDELWGIQHNQTDVDSTIVGAPPQPPSQTTSNTPNPNPAPRKRKIQLDSSDKLYDSLRDTNFAIVGTLLNKVARRLQNDYESRHGSKTTAELKDFVKKLPGYQAEHQSLKIHTGLAEEIMKHTRSDRFSRLLEAQQNLAAGADPSSQHEAIEELIARDMPLPEVLRLLCTYSCISGGVRSKDFDHFRRLILEGYGYQHLLTLNNLEKLQLFLSRSSPMASMIPMPGTGNTTGTKTNYAYLRKQLRLIVDEVNEHDPDDIAYVYSGYAPLSIRLVQCILEKQYLLSITRSSAVGVVGTMSSGGAQGWRGFDEVVKHARGPAFDEVQKGEDKAVKARALLSGGGEKKTVFVVFVGGITFTEIAALRFIAKKEEARRNIVVCTTSIISLASRDMETLKRPLAEDIRVGLGELRLTLATSSKSKSHTTQSIAAMPPVFFNQSIGSNDTTISTQPSDHLKSEPEIIVKIEDADIEPQSSISSSALPKKPLFTRDAIRPDNATILAGQENTGNSFESSTPMLSDRSELSSPPSSIPSSSKATTPIDLGNISKDPLVTPAVSVVSPAQRPTFDVRPRVSIPTDLAPHEYAHQCIAAAESSRLNPYALHPDEYSMLRDHISHAQVTSYLNIRNGILRLWINNPRIGVGREEAIGCAKDPRWYDVASVCHDWLIRSGHINFGAVEIPSFNGKTPKSAMPLKKGKTIVIVGAGMSGLGCARQLDSLFKQYESHFYDHGEEVPRVVVLEGRDRLGGRVYSRALDSSKRNPLNILVRGQLALPYHTLRPDTILYDTNGKAVDEKRDRLVEKLYNDCLERVSDYKFKSQPSKLIEGSKDLIDEGRDSSSDSQKTIATVEEAKAALPQAPPVSEQSLAPQINLVPVSTDRTPATLKAAFKAQLMGWALRDGVSEDFDLDLDDAAKAPSATLGSVVDEAITQYRNIVDLTAQDFRLMNWHVANLEYSNATNYHQLSLGGWDIDAVGGYQNLDVRKGTAVKKICYHREGIVGARVDCENGSTVEADYIVSTIPLGVLKHGNVEFEPRLPMEKVEAIGRLGFGILNKIILVYDHIFWDANTDIFGCLRAPLSRHSLKQSEYASQRGRGIPVLLALMAGDAGFDTEHSKNDELVAEATEVLRGVFGTKVPQPVHSIVTRWGSDRFARGSYSSAGPNMQVDDYQIMAQPIGNLFFAGEHTTDTHPATVHGAYLSGLRAAQQVPVPLVRPKESALSLTNALKRKEAEEGLNPKASKQARIEAYELALWQEVTSQIGERPWRPPKVAGNPYLLYSKANFDAARQRCEEGRRAGKGKPSPNEVRVMTSKMWKEALVADRKPYEDQAAEQKQIYNEALKRWEVQAADWDRRYVEIRAAYEKDHKLNLNGGEAESGRERRRAKIESYAESEASDEETME
ncbi:Sec1-like protein [Xylariaceae sp. FL0255]|nr:Sec1-like protein [Xylariaceae sp. FL0255]